MTVIPIGDYTPDVPAYLGQHSTIAANIYPRSDGSDGPLRGPVVMTGSVGAEILSGYTARSGIGTVYVFAGTGAKLLYQNGLTWTDKAGAAYAATRTEPWRWTQFGDYVIATNGSGDPPQVWLLGDAAAFADLTAVVTGGFVATIEPGFVMFGNIDDGTDKPNALQWSGINDHTSWPTIGTAAAAAAQSDQQELPNGGAIMGLQAAVGGAAGAVWTERAIYRIEYVGAPAIFAFREIVRGTGCMCPNATITINGMAYYISEEGFQRFDGQSETPIGFGRVSRTFLNTVDLVNLDRVYVTADPIRKIIVWAYPDSGATNGHPNKWLIYNYASDRWRFADSGDIVTQLVFPTRSIAYTLDTMDGVLPAGVDGYGTFPIDTPLYASSLQLLAGFDTSNQLVSFNGSTLAARVETGETDSKGNRVFVSGIRPLTDATDVTACVGSRETFADVITYGTSTAPGADAVAPQRADGRYVRARMDIPASAEWTYLQGADVTMRASGRR